MMMEHIERYQWAGVHQEPTLILLRSSLQSSSMCSSCMDTTRWNWRSRLGGGWPLVMMMLALSVNLAPLFILVAVAPNQKSNTLSTRFPPRTRRNDDGAGDREPTPVARPSSAFSCCSPSPPNNHALVSPIPEFETTRFPLYFRVLHLL